MNLAPLLAASPVIQIHALAAFVALFVGAVQLFRKKGDQPHRALGRVWVGLMALVALSSFFIWTIRLWGLFSPIHLISIFTLWMLWRGVTFARRHNIKMHMRTMQITYILALVVTGLFTLLPGRIMNKVVFGPDGATPEKLGILVVVIMVLAAASWAVLRWRRTAPGTAFVSTH